MHTMEYDSAVRMDQALPFATMWMNLEIILLSEISQTERAKNPVVSLTCGMLQLQQTSPTCFPSPDAEKGRACAEHGQSAASSRPEVDAGLSADSALADSPAFDLTFPQPWLTTHRQDARVLDNTNASKVTKRLLPKFTRWALGGKTPPAQNM